MPVIIMPIKSEEASKMPESFGSTKSEASRIPELSLPIKSEDESGMPKHSMPNKTEEESAITETVIVPIKSDKTSEMPVKNEMSQMPEYLPVKSYQTQKKPG